MIDRGKYSILGVYVSALDYEAAVENVIRAAKAKRHMAVSALANHGVMTGVLDPAHRYRLNHLDLIVPDGQSVRWALNWLYGTDLSDRVRGTTFMEKVCERAANEKLPIFLYGSTAKVLELMKDNLLRRYPGLLIASAEQSAFRRLTPAEKERIVRRIQTSGAAITFVGLGCPRQEVWVYEYRNLLAMPLLAVGAAFDFCAGLLPEPPMILQRLGLEWVHRWCLEPRRLWKRNLLYSPAYVALLLFQRFGVKKFDPTQAICPTEDLCPG